MGETSIVFDIKQDRLGSFAYLSGSFGRIFVLDRKTKEGDFYSCNLYTRCPILLIHIFRLSVLANLTMTETFQKGDVYGIPVVAFPLRTM